MTKRLGGRLAFHPDPFGRLRAGSGQALALSLRERGLAAFTRILTFSYRGEGALGAKNREICLILFHFVSPRSWECRRFATD